MKPEFGVIGYTNIDINRTPSTETILPGGAGYFSAIAASRIVNPVGFVTRIGYDFNPAFLLTRVLPEGVHQIMDQSSARSIQIYHSDTDKTNRDIEVQWGINLDLNTHDIPPSWLSTLRFVHVATMKPDQQSMFIQHLKQSNPNIMLSMDTDMFLLKEQSQKDQIIQNMRLVDFIFVNRHEYNMLKPVVDQAPHAVVKLDKDGAMYLSHGYNLVHVSTVAQDAVDATGAGDVFAGTFLACRLIGYSLTRSLEESVKIATRSVTRVGVEHLFS